MHEFIVCSVYELCAGVTDPNCTLLCRPAKEAAAGKNAADADSSEEEDNTPQAPGQPKKLTKNEIKQMEKERKERSVC
jgi:hypothetical protein